MNGPLLDVVEAGRDAGMPAKEAMRLARVVWTRQGHDPHGEGGAVGGKRDLVALVVSDMPISHMEEDRRTSRRCNEQSLSGATPGCDACQHAGAAATEPAVDAVLKTVNAALSERIFREQRMAQEGGLPTAPQVRTADGQTACDVGDSLEAGLTDEAATAKRPVEEAERATLHRLFSAASLDALSAQRYCEGCAANGVRVSELEALCREGKRAEILATLRGVGVLSVGHQQRVVTALGRAASVS